MSARVAKLEALLERVQQRAGEPRPVRAAAAAEVPVEEDIMEPEVDELGHSQFPAHAQDTAMLVRA